MSLSLDIKYATRLLMKKPKFTALIIGIVAIGLGLTLYAYSLLNSLLFTPIRFADGKNVYAVEAMYDHTHLERRAAMTYDLFNLQQDKTLFSDMGFYDEGTTFVGGTDAGLRKYNSSYVSYNLFSFTGVNPILGRGIEESDHFDGAEQVVVLGYGIWQGYFNGDPNIVGKIVPIDGEEPARVIGVMPEGFAFPSIAEIWQPLPYNAVKPTEREMYFVHGFAKLADGVTPERARAVLDARSLEIKDEVSEKYPWLIRENDKYLSIEPFKKAALTQYHGMFIALLIVVFLILMLWCINVGNLLLASVNERVKEVAIRVALGVPQKRLILQMLWESIFVCITGGILAILLAGWGLDITNTVLDRAYEIDKLKPYWWNVSLDTDSLTVLAIAIISMIVITGFIPAWRSLNGDFNAVLRDGTRGALGKNAARTTKALVISEILLSCVVLIMATVLLVSSYGAGIADYGVQTKNRLTAQIQISPSDYPIRVDTEFEYSDRLARSQFYFDLETELRAQPNVLGTVLMSQLPGTGGGTSFFEIEGRENPVINENPYSNNEGASKNGWATLGMKIIEGRDFDYRDATEEADSMIINESIARDFFPNESPIGQRVRRAGRQDASWSTIVGVVSDTYHGTYMDFSSASYNSYHPIDNWGPFRMQIAIHYTGSESQARETLANAVNAVNPNVGLYHVQSYDALIKKPLLLIEAVSQIFLICGLVAAFLAASGIYAVAANSVQQRTQEIGVRRALGCTDRGIIKLFMGQASWQLLIGIAVGVGLALWLLSLMSQTMIFSQVSYILGMLVMPALISAMVLIATYLPTKKVVEMEPSDALHHN
jgi:predicted permease